MTIVYTPTEHCIHLQGTDLPSPANHPVGTIARCDCGRLFRRGEDSGYAYWRSVSERRVARILRRAAKERGTI